MANLGLILLTVLAVYDKHVDGLGFPSCSNLVPGDFADPAQTSPSPFAVKVTPAEYEPGVPVTIAITFASSFTTFSDFILVARCEACTGSPISVGVFSDLTSASKKLNCPGTQEVVTAASTADKTTVAFKWTPPANFNNDVIMRASVIKTGSTWWANIDSAAVTKKAPQIPEPTPGPVTTGPTGPTGRSTSTPPCGNSAMSVTDIISTILPLLAVITLSLILN